MNTMDEIIKAEDVQAAVSAVEDAVHALPKVYCESALADLDGLADSLRAAAAKLEKSVTANAYRIGLDAD